MISAFDGLLLGALVLGFLYWILTWNFSYWKKRGIDIDNKYSVLFGSVADAVTGKKSFGELYTKLYNDFPNKKVVGWFKFRAPALLIRDPEIIRKIIVSDFDYFRNNDIEMDPEVDPIMGKNLFVLKDDVWKKNRALITPAFTAVKIKGIYRIMDQVAQDFVNYLKQHPEEIHVKSTMSRYTSEIVARCAFGIEGNNFKHSKPEMQELGQLIFGNSLGKYLKFMSFFLMPKLSKILRLKIVPDKVLNYFDSILRDVIIYRQENNIERNDLVQYFIEVKRKSLELAKGTIESEIIKKGYSDDDILSGCVMFFVEGYETSALILNNVLYHLAIHKEAQEKLRDEIDEVLKDGAVTFEKLNSMPYLHGVYAETNRILPATFTLQKVCTERYEMDIGKEKPLIIEKGTPIVIPLYAIHNDPDYWDSPEEYRPERFMNKEEANYKSKGIYMPFSDGPRVCPGARLASSLIKLAVVKIVSELEILPTSRTPKVIEPDPHYFMLAHKGGIYLKFAERAR